MSAELEKNNNFNFTGNLAIVIYAIIAAFSVYFYYEYALQYFVWNEESYGSYYWAKRTALALHLSGSTVALFAGLPQFWMGLRMRYMNVHRVVGRLYVIGVLIGSIGSFMLSTNQEHSPGFGFGFALFGLGVAWVVTTGAAFYAIRKGNFQLHKEWMIRSYIVTLAFVTFRLLYDYLPYKAWGIHPGQFATAMMWSCWVYPLLIAEVWIQFRKK